MSKRNIILAFALASALFAAPAGADGKPMKQVRGPAPLKAQPYCESGKGFFDDHGRWVCPVVTRTVVRQVAPPVVTRVVAPPPPPPAPAYDFSGFNGGVGSSIGSGYYGGGGGFIVEDRTRYSGVLQSSAAAFTFNHKVKRVTRRPPPRSHGGCGCN